jgi:hypothetical protein
VRGARHGFNPHDESSTHDRTNNEDYEQERGPSRNALGKHSLTLSNLLLLSFSYFLLIHSLKKEI